MKNISIVFAFLSIALVSCGETEVGTDLSGANSTTTVTTATNGTSDNSWASKLSNTFWEKECSSYNKLSTDELVDEWNVKISLSIDESLTSTYRIEYFHPTDTECGSMLWNALYMSTFDIRGKIISDESIEVNGLNETFVYSSRDETLSSNYTLLYLNSEKLYFGQKSSLRLGETVDTRHSSISLDDYFTQIAN